MCDQSKLKKDTIEMALQVNGKVRGKFCVDASLSKDEIEKFVLDDASLSKHFTGLTVRKMIVVPGRIVNVVAN